MNEISEQRAIQNGYDNYAQQEYFMNLEMYEDLSFSGRKRHNEEMEMKSYNPNEEQKVVEDGSVLMVGVKNPH